MTSSSLRSRVEVREAAARFHTKLDWLDSWHSFSFDRHFDPDNTHHGLLVVNNDDVIAPGTGFDTHPHRDMEIVTWVLSGSLVHQDSEGNSGVIYPGLAQRMSAGRGILHSERNDSWHLSGGPPHDESVHLVQMWVVPEEDGIDPGYEQRELAESELRGRLAVVASGLPRHEDDAAIRIHNRDAALLAARLDDGDAVTLPDAPYGHLFVALGSVRLEGAGLLVAGDAVRLTAAGARTVTSVGSSEMLVWEMHSAVERRG